MIARTIPTEEQDQIALIQWFDLWAPNGLKGRLAAVPNGGYRCKKTAGRLKAAGVRPGFPDLLLLVPRHGFAGLVIELKRLTGGVVSDDQRDWLGWLTDQNFACYLCRGFAEAQAVIQQYIRPATALDSARSRV